MTTRDVGAAADDLVQALDRLVAAAGALRQDVVDGAPNERRTAGAIRDLMRANDAFGRAVRNWSKTVGHR